MIYSQICDNTVTAGSYRGRWSALPAAGLAAGRCAVVVSDHVSAFAAVREHWQRSDTELLIIPETRYDDQLAGELKNSGFVMHGSLSGPVPGAEPVRPGRVWVSTSGSSGRPKRVAHTRQGLTTMSAAQAARRWLLPFTPGTYAWWQLVTLSHTVPDQDLVAVDAGDLGRWPAIAAREQVDAISATPTFWRYSLMRERKALSSLPLTQITLGGEPVDQPLLDELATTFPRTRVSWIYAAAETGAAFAVHDGKAGFPVSWLDRDAPDRPRLRVRDGELLVRSPYQGAELRGFVHTGDRAEIRAGRVHLTGRISHDQLNIGGSKVAASTVRQALLEHPEVVWARVAARRAPVVGQLVSAEIVTAAEVDRAELNSWCSARLPDYAVPRLITFRREVPLKEGLKSDL
jgi:acyl-CoA synthetase (AMP-forming)/AMP-acid ligase II